MGRRGKYPRAIYVPELCTGYPQPEVGKEGEDLDDLLDVPPFFGVESPPEHVDEPQENAPMGAGGEFGGGGASGTWSAPTPTQIKTKPGVKLPRRPEMLKALQLAALRGDVVTSGNDSGHLPNSLHYEDLAIDVRPAVNWQEQVAQYRAAGYKVLAEGITSAITPGVGTGRHLHISFDPEGRRV